MSSLISKRTILVEKFKNTKFWKFVTHHKKLVISLSLVFILLIVFIVPFIDFGTTRGDYTYAYNHYKDENVNGSGEMDLLTATFSTNVYTEEVTSGDNETKKATRVSEGDSFDFSVDVTTSGNYYFVFDYLYLNSGFTDSEFSVYIDDNEVLTRAKIRANFTNEEETFSVDGYGNEIAPTQILVEKWTSNGLYDYSFSSVNPYTFHLDSGAHNLRFLVTSGEEIAISSLTLKPAKNIKSYAEYASNYENVQDGVRLENEIQGEKFLYKNDTSPIPTTSSDINAYPYDTMKHMLNTVSNFNSATQILTYDFEVKTTGMYVININGLVDNSNHTTYASIFIDGEVPFGELMHYPFHDVSNITEYLLCDNDDNPYKFYFEAGVHTLSIKIDNSLYKDVIEYLESANTALNAIYLSLKRIAGTTTDNNKEWDPDTDFPGIYEEITEIKNSLDALIPILYERNGSTNNFQAVIYLQGAINALEGILKRPKLIPNQYASFSEGSSSIIENIANAKSDLETTPLDIERIVIGTTENYTISDKRNSFFGLWEGIKKFFLSFTYDYSGRSADNEKTLEIWVARSRQYVDLMQQLVDASDFKEKTGYDVNFVILSDESKLILSNAAKISPDGVMGISNWLPYEMGIRELTVDLTTFSDYGDVIERFAPGSLMSLIADGIGLGLPETQDFYVTYYRKDILDSYGLSVPNTWEEVIDILPYLQRNGYNYYIPLSTSTSSKSIMTTAPFIYQYGGNLFSDDGTRTTIDEENSLNAIKLMTELYTLYGLEDQVANFFNSFRNGSLPIGVSTFDTYVRLALGAPEINGKWEIALSPGVMQADGSISRWQTGSAQAMALIDKGEEINNVGWELLKWWSSAEVQAEFAQRLTLLYGKGYIWNSANLEAFSQSIIFSRKEKEIILEQWKYLREIPRVPGWYMLERELSNSWNNIVLNAQNTRAVIENAVTVINKELERKLIEFGYLNDDGTVIKPYLVTTFDVIESLKNRG